MGLEKSIASGKEKRKAYRKAKAFDGSCRNHGSCPYCESGRQHFDKKRRIAAENEITTWIKEGDTNAIS